MEAEVRAEDFAFVYLDVAHPAIAWLAYRGQLASPDIPSVNPSNISWFFVESIRRGLASTLRREGSLEGFRLKHFPSKASRLRCVYAFPNIESAQKANEGRGKFSTDNLVAIRPIGAFISEVYDSKWVTDFDSLPPQTAMRYWRGEFTNNPLPELLLSGRFDILGTQVRHRAYDIIRCRYPRSLAFLELARLAVFFDSDVGSISPWLSQERGDIIVRFAIRYSEDEGLEVWRKTLEEVRRNPRFQVNWADLKPLTDTTNDPVLDDLFSVPDLRLFEHRLRFDRVRALAEFVRLAVELEPIDRSANQQLSSGSPR